MFHDNASLFAQACGKNCLTYSKFKRAQFSESVDKLYEQRVAHRPSP